MSIPYTITDLTATVYIDGAPFTVDRTTNTFKRIVDVLSDPVLSPSRKKNVLQTILAQYGAELEARKAENKGRVEVTRRAVYFDGVPVHNSLSRRILDISAAGLPIDPWIAFTENLYSNPAEHAREELYDWLEGADLPISEDGCFLAYKRVTDNFTDIHTGTFDNSPGTVVTMPGGRPAVDPVRDNVCSTGLHFCSKEYLPNFGEGGGNKVVLVKINPADVVSIPSDYSFTKGRTWKYEVIKVVEDYATQTWEPVVDQQGEEWYRKDPFGNLILADPYAEEEEYEDEEYEEDEYEEDYTLAVYPTNLPAGATVVYPDRVGAVVRVYTLGGFDFDLDME